MNFTATKAEMGTEPVRLRPRIRTLVVDDSPFVIITSDAHPVTKARAEKAGADGFLGKEGNLQQRLIGALENLFDPSGASRAAATDKSFQNLPAKQTNQHQCQ